MSFVNAGTVQGGDEDDVLMRGRCCSGRIVFFAAHSTCGHGYRRPPNQPPDSPNGSNSAKVAPRLRLAWLRGEVLCPDVVLCMQV